MIPSEKWAREVVEARSNHRCELCGAHATDWAHRVARSRLGPWRPSNGIHLCGRHHRMAHAEPLVAEALGWSLRPTSDPTEHPAFLNGPTGLGWWLLDDQGGHVPLSLPTEAKA